MTGVMAQLDGLDRFPPTSRYRGLPRRVYETADGREVPYTPRRLLPHPELLTEVERHEVVDGDRLDLVAHRYYGDAEQWWQIPDANPALRPTDLTAEPGSSLRICLLEGTG